jgi:hypothetical protein
MYLATYDHYYLGGNGYESSSCHITADNLEDLRKEMAEIHYNASFDYWDDAGKCEINSNVTTSNWKIFHLTETIDIKTMPETQELMRARQERYDAGIAAKEAKKLVDQENAEVARHQLFQKLKAEYEGQDNA